MKPQTLLHRMGGFVIITSLLFLPASASRDVAGRTGRDVGALSADKVHRIGQTAPAPPWTVFTPADAATLPMSSNRLLNPGFSGGGAGEADHWGAYGAGYTVDETGGRGGGRALKLVNSAGGGSHGARQVITLNQTAPRTLYVSGWSKAANITGALGRDYAIYMDVAYTDGTWLYAQAVEFETGTHDWQFAADFLSFDKPVKQVYLYCMLLSSRTGTAWFDDLLLKEVEAEVATFDSVNVAANELAAPPYGGDSLALSTGDGVELSLAAAGGAITRLAIDGVQVHAPDRAYMSGFFVRDVADDSRPDFVHVGGELVQTGAVVQHTAAVAPLELDFHAVYTAASDRISIRADVTDTRGVERAITLYFALPIPAQGWMWGDTIRAGRTIAGAAEFTNLRPYDGIGATGYLSKYPWASLSGPAGGIALAVPLTVPYAMRLAHNPLTDQFYIAFDLGLSPHTTKSPGRASVNLIIYSFDADWGFRAATQGYYDRFPDAFTRRVPPEREGIWVPYSDLSPIPNVADFGVAFHEIASVPLSSYDDRVGVLSFRYIGGPWAYWFPIDDPSVNPHSYDQVIAYVRSRYQSGDSHAEATLSSGFFDENGRYHYESANAPWCRSVAGCALFVLNPDPDVDDATYPLNKANVEWDATRRDVYLTMPGLDGEYVDSFSSHANEMDFRAEHFAAADAPLTYRTGDWRVGIPAIFAVTEFARWLTQDVHQNLGKLVMANGMLRDWPWGADLFDFMGTETNWMYNGRFVPESDAALVYRRTLAFQRPYGVLMNTDFNRMSYGLVEQYFQTCLFYGFYPSMFSYDAASNIYWDSPARYERDRPLFRRYIPLIRRLNTVGWQPVTYATVSNPEVYIERFGNWPTLYFTLRNTRDASVSVNITLDAEALGIPAEQRGGSATGTLVFTRQLGPGAVDILYVSPHRLYLPLVGR